MEDTEPSRLRGAYDNYIKSKDYFRPNIPRNSGKCVSESCLCYILNFSLFCSIGLYGITLISYYSKDYFSLFAILAGFFVILVLFALIVIRKCDPCQPTALQNVTEEQTANQLDAQHASEEPIAHQPAVLHHRFFGLGRTFCSLRSCCPTVSTEDQRNETEEYTAYHLAALRNEIDEQTAAQHDTDEEEIVYRPAILRHRFFRLGRIFCCPRRCYPTVSTEDLLNETEEYTAYHPAALRNEIDEQTAAQHDTGEEEIVYRPAVLRHRFFRLGRIFCCPRRCYPTVSTEDLLNETEEYSAYHPAALRNEIDEQTAAQHDIGEEEIVYRPAVLRHRFFRLGRIFCCPRRCYPTVSTEDLRNQTEESATSQLAAQHDSTEEQTINQLDRIPVQTAAEGVATLYFAGNL